MSCSRPRCSSPNGGDTSVLLVAKEYFHFKLSNVTKRANLYGIVLTRAAVIMHGRLCLASADCLKHCQLQVMRHSCTFKERITSQWREYRQHVTFHFLHNQRQWNGQRATGKLVPTLMPLAPMCRRYHMPMHQMMHLREMWLQDRKPALHDIVQVYGQ